VEELQRLIATLSADGQQLLRSVRARAQAAGLRERYEPGRAGRGELFFFYGTVAETAAEVARVQLKADALPRLLLAGQEAAEAKEIAGLRDAAWAGDRLKAAADALRANEPQLDLFGKKK
jgi:hypothetical protein